jgi:hypothetical protein
LSFKEVNEEGDGSSRKERRDGVKWKGGGERRGTENKKSGGKAKDEKRVDLLLLLLCLIS